MPTGTDKDAVRAPAVLREGEARGGGKICASGGRRDVSTREIIWGWGAPTWCDEAGGPSYLETASDDWLADFDGERGAGPGAGPASGAHGRGGSPAGEQDRGVRATGVEVDIDRDWNGTTSGTSITRGPVGLAAAARDEWASCSRGHCDGGGSAKAAIHRSAGRDRGGGVIWGTGRGGNMGGRAARASG